MAKTKPSFTKKPTSNLDIPTREKKPVGRGNLFLRNVSPEAKALFKQKANDHGYPMNEFFEVIVELI